MRVSFDAGDSRVFRRAWTGSGPVKFAFVDVDRDLVDACLPTSHQPLIVKLPEFIAISPEPLAALVVVLVLEANRDPAVTETPQ
jgi:hypothetical protein